MFRRIYVFLILVSLVTVGCQVRSAGEDTDPTPPGDESILVGPAPSVEVPTREAVATVTETATATETVTTIMGPSPTSTVITPTNTTTVTETATVGQLQTDTPTVMMVSTNTPTASATSTATPSATIMPSTNTATSTSTSTATSTSSATMTPTVTASNTASPSPSATATATATRTPTPTLRFTQTFTPFPPPTITPLGFSETGIGGGDASVAQAPSATATATVTQPPIVVAQQPTINPNQATATAFWLTQAANLGTIIVVTEPGSGAAPPVVVSTSTFTPTPTVLYPDCEHYVDPGATLGSIARLYGIDQTFLAEYNVLNNTLEYNLQTNPDYLRAGDYLVIPGCGRIPSPTPTLNLTQSAGGGVGPPSVPDNSLGPINYTVVEGDTIYQLSLRFGVTMAQIVSANPTLAGDINSLSVGTVLTIPKRSQFTATPTIGPGS